MDNSVPCGHLPPLIPADSSVAQSLIDKFSLPSGRRRSSLTDASTGIGNNDSCLVETGSGNKDQDHFCSLLLNGQQKHPDDQLVILSPEVDPGYQPQQNTNTTSTLFVKNKIGDNGCWLAGKNSLSQPENLLAPEISGGETSSSVQSVGNSCCSSRSSMTNGISSAKLSPLASGTADAGTDGGVTSVDDKEALPSSKLLFVCSPQSSPVNLISASLTNKTGCAQIKSKSEKTLVNNLQAARPKEQTRDPGSCNLNHQQCNQWHLNNHCPHYVQDYGRTHQINIPVESHYSTLDDTNQNSLSSVSSQNNPLSVSAKQQLRCSALSMNENTSLCPSLKSTTATDPQSISPAPLPTSTMPYSNNCVPFKQGQLVHSNWPKTGNMVCTPKCCVVCSPNGLVIASDFKSMDINKMSQQANGHPHNNNHHQHHQKKKHSSVAELFNYKNGHESAGGATSNTKTVLLQSNLNSSQPTPQQHYHACKSLKCEKLAANTQAHNSTLISSSSQGPSGTTSTVCTNCNSIVKTLSNANASCASVGNTSNSNLMSKKCKALHNLQYKFQKNRFISSLQDCCRACNTYDGCRGSTESLELEAGLLCPSYSYCDSENVTSTHNSKENHNYKNQLASLVNDSASLSLPLSKSNNNCSSTSTCRVPPNNFQTNDFSLSSTGHPSSGSLVAGVDMREEDFGDFIEADFPLAQTSGRLMSSSTDSTESCSSLTSSDMHDMSSPNQPPTGSLTNNITTTVSDRIPTQIGVTSLCNTFFKNNDYKTNNQTSSAAPICQTAAAYSSPMVTGANPSLKKCCKNTPPNPSHSSLPASCPDKLVEGNNVKREQASSVIKCSDVSKISSSLLSSSSSLSLQSPVSSPSSSSSSPSSASFPTCSFLCSGDRHSHAKHKADKNTSSDSGSRPTAETSTNSRSSSNSCPHNMPSPLPLAGISAGAQAGPNSTTQQPSATFLLSPEVDFLDFDFVPPTTDSEANLNSAGSSNGTAAFDFSLYEIPYADEVDSACPSPVEELSPNMVIGAAGGSLASHPVLVNCATNDLSASSSNSNLSSRSTLEDAVLPPGHSNLETVRAKVQNAYSNLYLDYRDDVSVDSEETGSHDSNEISEGDEPHPNHHRQHHCVLTLPSTNGSLNNNLFISPDSLASSQDMDLRENPGVSEPIYEDIDGVHLDKCTADSPGDKCCCISPDVSACGPIAVLNVLTAFDYPVDKSKVLEKAPVNLRDTSASIAPYLFSRAKAGTTAEVLIKCVESVTNGAIRGRFFDFHPQRDVHLLKWLGEWMKKDAVPLATLNIQKSVPDPWHHQMIYGVSSEGVYLTNSLKLVSEESLMQQLTSDSVLLIPRFDIISRFNEETNLSQLMTHKNSNMWRTMNVLGQVVNVLREASMPRQPGYQPQLTQHIRIPAAYRAGITLFIRQEAAALHELMNAPDLPLKVDSPPPPFLLEKVALPTPGKARELTGDGNKDVVSGTCCVSHLMEEHPHQSYPSYEYTDNNYYDGSSARMSPSVSFGSDLGAGAAAAAPTPSETTNSTGSLHTHQELHDYVGGARYFGNQGYPRRNNVYIHYFNS